jgi:hypothetical protein
MQLFEMDGENISMHIEDEEYAKVLSDEFARLKNESPKRTIDFEDLDAMIENDSYTPEQLAFVKKAMYDMVSKIQEITGQEKKIQMLYLVPSLIQIVRLA